MSESENIERVVASLNKVPAKQLKIIELANTLTMKDGELDYEAVANIQPEVQLAVSEAKMYGSATLMAVDRLKKMNVREEDV